MKTRYSKTTGAFYPLDIDYAELPADLIDVSIDDYQAAMARPAGYTFDFVAGKLVLTPPRAQTLDEIKAVLTAQIDSDIAAIYSRWTRFQSEYEQREAAARVFKNGGYAGDPGIWVTSYASAAGKTPQQATDTIIAQADALHNALAALGAQRMRKYGVLAATDEDMARTIHADIALRITQIAEAIQ